MYTFLHFVISLLAASSIFAEKPDVCSGGHIEFHPSLTIYEKGEEYVKLIGPLYFKATWSHDFHLPIKRSQKQDIYIGATPTKEINSLFAVGKVFQNGVQILRYDGEDDLCTDQLCPLAKCRHIKRHFLLDIGGTGLLPATYSGNITIYSYNENYEKYHVGGLQFNIKIV